MAIDALARRVPVDDAAAAVRQDSGLVASRAPDRLVSAGKFECGLGVVIEIREFPGRHRVAPGANGRLRPLRKLPAVDIVVTSRALPGSGSVQNAPDAGSRIRGFVAFCAQDGPVRSFKRESGG
jgi:hypothetical protein